MFLPTLLAFFLLNGLKVKHFVVSMIPDSLLIKTINCATASSLWKAICAKHETKTKRFAIEMLCNLHNQHYSETDDIRQHFVKMVKHCEELVITRKVIDNTNFTPIITNSLPPSYNNVISAAYSATITINKDINTDQIITVIQEEYACCQISSGNTHPTSTALFSNPQKQSSKWNDWKKDICTNEKCQFCSNHKFKDC